MINIHLQFILFFCSNITYYNIFPSLILSLVQKNLLSWKFLNHLLQIQWLYEKKITKIWICFSESWKITRYLDMVQVSRQQYMDCKKLLIPFLIAKFGYIGFWMIITLVTSQNWKKCIDVHFKSKHWKTSLFFMYCSNDMSEVFENIFIFKTHLKILQ